MAKDFAVPCFFVTLSTMFAAQEYNAAAILKMRSVCRPVKIVSTQASVGYIARIPWPLKIKTLQLRYAMNQFVIKKVIIMKDIQHNLSTVKDRAVYPSGRTEVKYKR